MSKLIRLNLGQKSDSVFQNVQNNYLLNQFKRSQSIQVFFHLPQKHKFLTSCCQIPYIILTNDYFIFQLLSVLYCYNIMQYSVTLKVFELVSQIEIHNLDNISCCHCVSFCIVSFNDTCLIIFLNAFQSEWQKLCRVINIIISENYLIIYTE